jgi:hypothetical protein
MFAVKNPNILMNESEPPPVCQGREAGVLRTGFSKERGVSREGLEA